MGVTDGSHGIRGGGIDSQKGTRHRWVTMEVLISVERTTTLVNVTSQREGNLESEKACCIDGMMEVSVPVQCTVPRSSSLALRSLSSDIVDRMVWSCWSCRIKRVVSAFRSLVSAVCLAGDEKSA